MSTKVITIRIDESIYKKVAGISERTGNNISETLYDLVCIGIDTLSDKEAIVKELAETVAAITQSRVDITKRYIRLGMTKEDAKRAWEIANGEDVSR